MRNELVAINTLTDTLAINIKSIYKTEAEAGDSYKCKLQGDSYYCYVYVVKGKITFHSIQPYQFDLMEGQAVFLWSNEICFYTFSKNTQYFWVYFSLSEKNLILMNPFSVSKTEKAIGDFYRCVTLVNRSTVYDLCRANMIFTKYVLEGVEILSYQETYSKGWHRASIEMSINYIKDNLYNVPMLQELANRAGMSVKQYRKHFKKVTGQFPVKYISEQRLLMTKDYLVNTNMSISQISEILQFSSPYYFSACFKKEFGCTPSEYRKKFKK